MNPNTIGGFIAQVRKSNGMTQLELAEKLNISNRTVSKWENGDGYPDITLLESLASTLHITVDELLKGAYRTDDEDVRFRFFFYENKKDWRTAIHIFQSRHFPFYVLYALILFVEIMLISLRITMVRAEFEVIIYHTMIWLMALFFGFILLNNATFPHRNIRRSVLFNRNQLPETRITFGKTIRVQRGQTVHEHDPQDITRFCIGKSVYLFVINKRIIFYIPKSAVANAAEFEQYAKSYAGTVSHFNGSFKYKVITVLLLILSVIMAALTAFYGYYTSDNYFYKDITAKAAVFEDNQTAFENSIIKLESDKDLKRFCDDDGNLIIVNEKADYIDVTEIEAIHISEDAIVFYPYDDGNYLCGYVYYDGDAAIPRPENFGYETALENTEACYQEADDLILIGKTKNGTLTRKTWYLLKELDGHWYYFEEHNF